MTEYTSKTTSKIGTLYIDDNLDVMRDHLRENQFDLVYLDPPYNSKRDYNINFKNKEDIEDPEQTKGFEDTWSYLKHQAKTDSEFKRIELNDDKLSRFLQFVKEGSTKDCNHFAYLTFMSARLHEIRSVLKSTGSVYLHVDPTESHYLKIVMDLIFGPDNFRNEIIWHYGLGGSSPKQWASKHDVILMYSKTKDMYYKPIMVPATSNMMKGQLKKQDDVWDIPTLNNMAKERLGYPTQKPEALLERIVLASCPADGIMLDPFCGCGTSCAVAAKNGISYVGIDISSNAQEIITKRFLDAGVSAPKIVSKDGFTIQMNVNRHLKFHNFKEHGADGGIDGYQTFRLKNGGLFKAISSVKSGAATASQFRDFCHVVKRDGADMGIFVMRDDPTTTMLKEQNAEGYYNKDVNLPRIQILKVDSVVNDDFILKLPEGAVRE